MELWNRFRYMLSPQFDIYEQIATVVRGNVADVGFGTGFGTHLLTTNANCVIGYEVDEQSINFAQRVFNLPKLQFTYGDIQSGIEEDGFNFVVMIDIIEHIQDDSLAISNAKKMLTTGGSLIISTPNRNSRYRRADTHVREYSPNEFRELLQTSFKKVNLKNYRLDLILSDYENPMIAICRKT